MRGAGMKAQPLTVKERFVVYKLKASYFTKTTFDDVHHKWVYTKVPRTATSARNFIRGRRDNPKYNKVLAAWVKTAVAMQSGDYESVKDAYYSMQYALKFQGYLQLQLVLAERAAEGKSDEDLAAMMMGDAL